MKKNTGALVVSIIGAVLAILGGILWSTCADAIGSVGSAAGADTTDATIYLIVFLVLGIGGGVIGLLGGIWAYSGKSKAVLLCVLGLLTQVGNLIAECVSVSGFSFLLSMSTLMAIVLFLVAVILAARKKN